MRRPSDLTTLWRLREEPPRLRPASEQAPPPNLEIESKTQFGDRMIIRGTASMDGRLEVFINGAYPEDVPIRPDGQFSVMVEATVDGLNVVRLIATNKSGQTTVREVELHATGY